MITMTSRRGTTKTETLQDRFLRYVKMDTQSQEDAKSYPSTAKQLVLLKMLAKELKALGLKDVRMDRYGYVMATVPGNLPAKENRKVPAVGFVAHVDTSPEVSGAGVKPQVVAAYDGKDIKLPGDPSVVIRVSENPDLRAFLGKTIITSDGTTLLGADDKAGVAIIMAAAQEILASPHIPRGDVKIAFTPDEEVGNGTKFFDIKAFGAKYAYTIDGDKMGELNKETFSADTAVLTVTGRDIHPGMAKDIMVNASRVACEVVSRLPKDMAPETTAGYEPYIHPYAMEGGIGKAAVKLLLRDFKTAGLAGLKERIERAAAEVKKLFPKAVIELRIIESYRNMGPALEKEPLVLENLWDAVKRSGLDPRWDPIRGGTDGARLTAKGLPTPNIWYGGCNAHSKTEWASVYAMEKSQETVLNLVKIWAERSR